jgi:hypothetical protein
LSTVSSIFSQVLKLIPRSVFDSAVHKHAAERNSKGFSSWGQFVAMLFCQLGSVHWCPRRLPLSWTAVILGKEKLSSKKQKCKLHKTKIAS